MIRVTYGPEKWSVTVEGHSGSAPKGEDLICAAATILTLTLAETVEAVCEERELELREGYAKIRGGANAAPYFDFVRTGFGMINGMHPEHLTVEDKIL